jgi:hypothetical protein
MGEHRHRARYHRIVPRRALSIFRPRESTPVEVKRLLGEETTMRVIQCGAGQTWVDPRIGASWVDPKSGRR